MVFSPKKSLRFLGYATSEYFTESEDGSSTKSGTGDSLEYCSRCGETVPYNEDQYVCLRYQFICEGCEEGVEAENDTEVIAEDKEMVRNH